MYTNGDKSNPELKIQVEIKDNTLGLSSQEFNDQAENPDTSDEKDKGEEEVQHHVAKVPSRQRKLSPLRTKSLTLRRTFFVRKET